MTSTRIIANNINPKIPMYLLDDYKRELVTRIIKIGKDGDKLVLIFENTIFYPGGGHQPQDTGRVIINNQSINVFKVEKKNDEILHYIDLESIKILPEEGSIAKLEIDWDRRYKVMRLHTAEHIFMRLIRREGYELEDGQWGPEYGIITFNEEIPIDILLKCEEETNEIIREDLPIYRIIDDNYIKIKIGDFSERPCGGTHVSSTGEIGFFKITRVLKRGKTIHFDVGTEAINKVSKAYNNSLIIGYTKLNLRQDISSGRFYKAINDLIRDLSYLRTVNDKLYQIILKTTENLPRKNIKIGNINLQAYYLDLVGLDIQAKHLKKLGQLVTESDRCDFLAIRLTDNSLALLFKRSKKMYKELKKELGKIMRESPKRMLISSIEGGLLIKSENKIDYFFNTI